MPFLKDIKQAEAVEQDVIPFKPKMPKLIKQISAQTILETQLINLCCLWEKEVYTHACTHQLFQ